MTPDDDGDGLITCVIKPDIDALQRGLREAGARLREGLGRLTAKLGDTMRPALWAVAHEVAFRRRAWSSGERVCPGLAEQHFALTGQCPTCGAEV